MQSLLRWSLEHSEPQGPNPAREVKPIDPGIIDMILGRPDSELMKEDVAVATDESKPEEERIAALDHLEMLVESIDNANDLVKLNLWQPIQGLLTSPNSTEEIKTQALWIIGTAVQNNPSAQDVYLGMKPLPALLDILDPSKPGSSATRAKAIYTLSGFLKHNLPALEALGPEGWNRLRESIQDPSITVRRKVIFLLSTLLTSTTPHASPSRRPADLPTTTSTTPAPASVTPTAAAAAQSVGLLSPAPTLSLGPATTTTTTFAAVAPPASTSAPESQSRSTTFHGLGTPSDPIHPNSHAAHLFNPSRTSTWRQTTEAVSRYGIIDAVVSAIVDPVPYGNDGEFSDPDEDFEEKSMRLLYTFIVVNLGSVNKQAKDHLREWIQRESAKVGEAQLLERWNIDKTEFANLVDTLV